MEVFTPYEPCLGGQVQVRIITVLEKATLETKHPSIVICLTKHEDGLLRVYSEAGERGKKNTLREWGDTAYCFPGLQQFVLEPPRDGKVSRICLVEFWGSDEEEFHPGNPSADLLRCVTDVETRLEIMPSYQVVRRDWELTLHRLPAAQQTPWHFHRLGELVIGLDDRNGVLYYHARGEPERSIQLRPLDYIELEPDERHAIQAGPYEEGLSYLTLRRSPQDYHLA